MHTVCILNLRTSNEYVLLCLSECHLQNHMMHYILIALEIKLHIYNIQYRPD